MPRGRGPVGFNNLKKINKSTIKRLLSYITGTYKFLLVVVFICILASAIAGVLGSLFLQVLIDDYIAPLALEANPVFTGLLKAICIMGGIYFVGVLSTFLQTRIMAVITQGMLKRIRDDMFSHMETLPIKYFDTHAYGDIMSIYTNDTDALRQMISQSIPQVFSSIITIVTVFAAMIYLSPWLTLMVLGIIALMFFVTSKIGSKSANYFMRQQESLGNLNGYIEELINGQKVVKVFCHEEQAKAEFDRRNEVLRENADKANKYSIILMPVIANLGNLQYVLIAIVGGALALNGINNLTLGAIASFLNLSKSFIRPISQVAQQISSIAMALAGAERIFGLIDEESEKDDGYVTLVNAKYNKEGNLIESKKRTGI